MQSESIDLRHSPRTALRKLFESKSDCVLGLEVADSSQMSNEFIKFMERIVHDHTGSRLLPVRTSRFRNHLNIANDFVLINN